MHLPLMLLHFYVTLCIYLRPSFSYPLLSRWCRDSSAFIAVALLYNSVKWLCHKIVCRSVGLCGKVYWEVCLVLAHFLKPWTNLSFLFALLWSSCHLFSSFFCPFKGKVYLLLLAAPNSSLHFLYMNFLYPCSLLFYPHDGGKLFLQNSVSSR